MSANTRKMVGKESRHTFLRNQKPEPREARTVVNRFLFFGFKSVSCHESGVSNGKSETRKAVLTIGRVRSQKQKLEAEARNRSQKSEKQSYFWCFRLVLLSETEAGDKSQVVMDLVEAKHVGREPKPRKRSADVE